MYKRLKQEYFFETLGRAGLSPLIFVFKQALIQLADICPSKRDLLCILEKNPKQPTTKQTDKNNPPKAPTNMGCLLYLSFTSAFLASALALGPTDFNK